MSDNSKISQLVPATAPLLDADDFIIRRGSGNFRVSRLEMLEDPFATGSHDRFLSTTSAESIFDLSGNLVFRNAP